MSAEKVNRFWASLLTIHSLLGGTILLIIEPWLMMGHLWLVNIEKYGYALFWWTRLIKPLFLFVLQAQNFRNRLSLLGGPDMCIFRIYFLR
jgi:hypothetical protein